MSEIKAYHRMEERYEGLQLVFGTDEAAKEKILQAIETAKSDCGIEPAIFENCDTTHPEKCAIYIEFNDDYRREAGAFFEEVLQCLCITKCS